MSTSRGPVILVTGVSGSGKTTIARALRRWGHRGVDADAESRLAAAWADPLGHPATRPGQPDRRWPAEHR